MGSGSQMKAGLGLLSVPTLLVFSGPWLWVLSEMKKNPTILTCKPWEFTSLLQDLEFRLWMLRLIDLELTWNGVLQTVDEICQHMVKKEVSGVSCGFLQAHALWLCCIRGLVGKKQQLCKCWCMWWFAALLTKLDSKLKQIVWPHISIVNVH